MKTRFLWFACVLAGWLPAAGAADPSAARPGWADALEGAWQRALALPETRGLRARAAAEQALANRPWASAPQLEIGQRSDRFHADRGARETELGVGVPLWRLGQREAQRAAAAGLVQLARAEEAAARLELAGQLREQAWQLRLLQAAWRQAQLHQQLLDDVAADVARRVQAGDLAETDGMAARA